MPATSVIPVSEDYTAPVAVDEARAASEVGGALVALADGWRLRSVAVSTLTIGFADANDPLARSGVVSTAERRIPVVASESLPAAILVFERGDARVDVEIVRVDSGRAALWSRRLTQSSDTQAFGIGRGAVSGATFVAESQGQLIRATYADLSGAPDSPRDAAATTAGALAVARGLRRT